VGSDVGVYSGILDEVLSQQGAELSYLARDWPEIDQWRTEARDRLAELLAFRPAPVPLDARTERSLTKDDVEIEEVSWEVGYGPRCAAWVLKPEGVQGKLPAVLALHDHGGFKYFGKEKIAETDRPYPLTPEHRASAYEGVAWANALAREGFLVLVHDAFAAQPAPPGPVPGSGARLPRVHPRLQRVRGGPRAPPGEVLLHRGRDLARHLLVRGPAGGGLPAHPRRR
jgi:hypothetical protein